MKSRRSALLLSLALVAGLIVVVPGVAAAEPPVVLVWGGSYGWRHPSITNGELAFTELAAETGAFTAIVTENPALLNAETLSRVDAIAWISTTGKPPFTPQQRDEIIRFAGCGGGNLAFHAAADSNYGWAEYAELIGAQFDSHPKGAGSGEARMIVENGTHPITAGWAGQPDFMLDDEYYRWRTTQGIPGVSLPRNLPDTDVLLSLDETTVDDDIQQGPLAYEHQQPIAWTKTFRGRGRVYYNNMGHSEGTWSEEPFRTSLVNGVSWVTEQRLDLACFRGDEPLPAPQGPPPVDPETIVEPCVMPEVHDRSGGFTWQRSGPIKRLTEAGDSMTLPTAGIPGNLSWGAQFYVLDLTESGAHTADVVVELGIPNALDDYDLSVSTGWGWYGSQAPQGAASERVVLTDVPHCSVLQMYGDNLYGVSQQAPSLSVAVTQNAEPGGDGDLPLPQVEAPQGQGVIVAPPSAVTTGFVPPVVVVPQGSTVTFVNQDQSTHDVTSTARGADGKPLFTSDYRNPEQSGPVNGVENLPPGTYPFSCSLHGAMTGELTVF